MGCRMYLKNEELFNVIYSVDMLRLKCYITDSTFSEIEFRFNTCWKDFVKACYTSAKIEQFFFNYNIEIEEGKSFWFGFKHNSEKTITTENELVRRKGYNFTIEFNPNKLKDDSIILYLLSISDTWYLKSLDLACDVKVNILDIIYDKNKKRNVHFFSKGYDDKTIYIGEGNGRVKIYNKKRESNLEILGDLTRIEISMNFEDFFLKKLSRFFTREF